ncbi:MAG: MBL fold metallo-hydrolase [Pseudomonadota bacterium]
MARTSPRAGFAVSLALRATRTAALLVAVTITSLTAAHATGPRLAQAAASLPSHCIALVDHDRRPPVRFAATRAKLDLGEVRIRYVGHSSFRIETPGGITIITDYAGYAGEGPTPQIATMNRAHSSHFTTTPDPDITHVLPGWNPAGGPARHNITVRDVRVRNVPTDIRNYGGGRIEDGNSIFVFEAAGLCIGHLGHLHHKLSPDDIAKIGRLDVVLVPVDGTFTMDQESMRDVATALKSKIVIPMHWFTINSLNAFLLGAAKDFTVETLNQREIVISLNDLPSRPKVLVLSPF